MTLRQNCVLIISLLSCYLNAVFIMRTTMYQKCQKRNLLNTMKRMEPSSETFE